MKGGRGCPPHAADDDCAENGSAKRTAAGRSYRNLRILTRFCAAKWIPSPMRSFFLFGPGAVGGRFRFAVGKYKIETVVKEPTVIYMERPLKRASHTIHIEVPPNPFWASIGLSVTPLPLGSGVQYESRVSLGYFEPEFSKRCQGWYPLRAGARLVRLERNGL